MKVVRPLRPVLVVLLLVAAAACRTTSAVSGVDYGPRRAVQGFLDGVRTQNGARVADHWGTAAGPARERMGPQELEQRVFVMMRCLRHDSARVRTELAGTGQSRILRVDLYRGAITRQTAFTAVPASGGRWYVEQVDMEPVKDLCANR